MATIGVFDSGVGGLSIARAIEHAMPEHTVRYANDTEHMPYGDKTPQQVFTLVVPILQKLVDEGCEVLVIACNTVTTNHITQLRQLLSMPLLGIEPMIKPAAAQTTSGVIAVCATPSTLASARYHWLKDTYAADITVLEPDCSDWAYMIEHNQVNEAKIRAQIESACGLHADIIVLGCTHYHWIEDFIKQVAGTRAVVMQPEQVIIARLRRVLSQLR